MITHLSEGTPLEDIVAGIHDAIASRVVRMVNRLKIEPEILFIGGVAKNRGVLKALENNLNCRVLVPEEPLLTGALGAALSGKEIITKAAAQGKPMQRPERRLEEVKFFDKG